MGKRSSFERRKNDKYYTPYDACLPLFPFLAPGLKFIEPCAGDGRLIRHMEKVGHSCVYASDIEPEGPGIIQRDLLFFDGQGFPDCDMVITNPPWERELLHPMIKMFMAHAPAWLLFDAAWAHTGQCKELIRNCRMIISIGRVSWAGNGKKGMDDCCWYLFDKEFIGYPQFVGPQ